MSTYSADLMYWGEVKGILANVCNQMRSTNITDEYFDILSLLASNAIHDADQNREGLNEVLSCEALILSKLLPCKDLYTHEQVLGSAKLIHTFLIKTHLKSISKRWSTYMKEQLSLGGAQLYKYIAKWDKRFLNVSWDTQGVDVSSPAQFLAKQKIVWGKLWNPNDPQMKAILLSEFEDFREIAVQHKDNYVFGVEELNKALRNYKKTSLGSDMWSPDELRRLPDAAKIWIAGSIEAALNEGIISNQQWLSSIPSLGKKVGRRTICKAPMLSIMTLRGDSEVSYWE